MLVCHHCDTPLCIRPEHLFLGSQKDNSHDRDSKGRRADHSGAKHPLAKLSDEQVATIRSRRAGGEKLASIAADYGVSFQHVSALARGVFRART
jgi:hypothetical protein